MPNNLTNKEIAKVFAMYLECYMIRRDKAIVPVRGKSISFCETYGIGERKLLLTPLQSISDEDAIIVSSFAFTDMVSYDERVTIGKNYVYYIFMDGALSSSDSNKCEEFSPLQATQIYQYLIDRGYDLPLFFAPNHWANNKTAIELNIAIPKTN